MFVRAFYGRSGVDKAVNQVSDLVLVDLLCA